MQLFDRYIGIDYSGAQTPITTLKGLHVYLADRKASPIEVPPPPSPRKYWTRRGIAEWVAERLVEAVPTIVGIDHSFSFPLMPTSALPQRAHGPCAPLEAMVRIFVHHEEHEEHEGSENETHAQGTVRK